MNQPIKPYELTFDLRPFYLHAHMSCKSITPEIALAYLREIVDECQRRKYTRTIIERDCPSTLSDLDLYNTTLEFIKMGSGDLRIAFVDTQGENADYLEMAIMISKNRGAAFEHFDNISDAEGWLLKA